MQVFLCRFFFFNLCPVVRCFEEYFFLYMPWHFRTRIIVTLHNCPSLVAPNNVCPFAILPTLVPSPIYKNLSGRCPTDFPSLFCIRYSPWFMFISFQKDISFLYCYNWCISMCFFNLSQLVYFCLLIRKLKI